ncbi:MAG: hypothetical protein JXJ19_07395, partial [Elusimicrobia bacterium]|nr:hypothetical protein [Elusimicrobiota bacterium]
NNICENEWYNYKHLANTNITLGNNWWGCIFEGEVKDSIMDYYDDYNLGKVFIADFLRLPIEREKDIMAPVAYVFITPDKLNPGQNVEVKVIGIDDKCVTGLSWQAEYTGDAAFDSIHSFECSVSTIQKIWQIETGDIDIGGYRLKASAVDASSKISKQAYCYFSMDPLDKLPPSVEISIEPGKVIQGEKAYISITGHDNYELAALGWSGDNTGVEELDDEHWYECAGTSYTWVYELDTTGVNEGIYRLLADAQDIAYPVEGEPHRVSETGEPQPWATLIVDKKDLYPPDVNIAVFPSSVLRGEDIKITVSASDDKALAAFWWWGNCTGYENFDKTYWYYCSGISAEHTWTMSTYELLPGTYSLLANSCDSMYPTPGEAHQASDGSGLGYFVFTVEPKDIAPPSVSISVDPYNIIEGGSVTVTLNGTDDKDLGSIWWRGVNTGIETLDVSHIYSCSGSSVTHSWVICTEDFSPGEYKLATDARDAVYPVEGEIHQASEAYGPEYGFFNVEKRDKLPPEVCIYIEPENIIKGSTFTVTINATDDKDLAAVWWWGISTGEEILDKVYLKECSGENFTCSWNIYSGEIATGTYRLAADARDRLYPKDGEAHQSSEADGTAYIDLEIEPKDIAPPKVSIRTLQEKVIQGEKLQIIVEATDDKNLAEIWWWAENTSDEYFDKCHFYSCSGKEAGNLWEVSTSDLSEGIYRLAADARDSAYPVTGEAHQASDGDGIGYVFIEVEKRDSAPPSVNISIEPSGIRWGEDFNVTITAQDDKELESFWWWALGTGCNSLDEIHYIDCSGTKAVSTWTFNSADLPLGTFKFAADAQDALCPIAGASRKASDGEGYSYAYLSVKDDIPPTVFITQPLDDTCLDNYVKVIIDAADNYRMDIVRFYVDGDFVKEDEDPPYAFYWNTRKHKNGVHEIKVKAYDFAGNKSEATISVRTNNRGTARAWIRVPGEGMKISGNAVSIVANTDINAGAVKFQAKKTNSEEWFDISDKITCAPYSVYWNTDRISNGSYCIRAIAYDEDTFPDFYPKYIKIEIDDDNWDIKENGNPDMNPGNEHRKCERISTERESHIITADGTGAIIPPEAVRTKNAVLEIVTVSHEDMLKYNPPDESSVKPLKIYRKFEFSNGEKFFGKDITLTLPYSDDDDDGVVDGTDIEAKNLKIFYLDEQNERWCPVNGTIKKGSMLKQVSVKKENDEKIVTAKVDHFTVFALMAYAPAEDLDSVIVYPNPFKPNDGLGHESIIFDGLTDNVKVRIFTVAGRLAREWEGDTAPWYQWEWDGKNDSGDDVASGLYIYVVTADGKEKARGKIVVIR